MIKIALACAGVAAFFAAPHGRRSRRSAAARAPARRRQPAAGALDGPLGRGDPSSEKVKLGVQAGAEAASGRAAAGGRSRSGSANRPGSAGPGFAIDREPGALRAAALRTRASHPSRRPGGGTAEARRTSRRSRSAGGAGSALAAFRRARSPRAQKLTRAHRGGRRRARRQALTRQKQKRLAWFHTA